MCVFNSDRWFYQHGEYPLAKSLPVLALTAVTIVYYVVSVVALHTFNASKKVKKSYLIFSLLLSILIGQSQTILQTIRGRTIDQETNAALPGAIITLVNNDENKRFAVADSAGYFMLVKVPVGRQNLKISMFGYQDVFLNNIEVTSGKEPFLTIPMLEKTTSLDGVTIVAKKEKERTQNTMVSVSGRTFSLEESNRYAGGFGDLTRMAQSFAGVASSDGQSNEIIIRGNNPRGLLWRVEGVEVSNPNHFPRGDGSAGGGISMIQSTVIDNSDFLTGAFPAEYGNASSGVFDIRLRNGNAQKFEHSIQLGVIGVEASTEGPLDRKLNSSYFIKYRYSTVSLLQKIGIKLVDNSVTPSYQDLTFKFNIHTKKAGTFTFWGIAGMSGAGEKATKDSLSWKNIADKTNAGENYKSGMFGLKHFKLLKNQRSSFTTILSYNIDNSQFYTDTFLSQYNNQRIFSKSLTYQTARAAITFNHKKNIHQSYRIGVIISVPAYQLQSKYLQSSLLFKDILNQNGTTSFMQGFVQHKYRMDKGLELNTGIHLLYYFLSHRYAIEPRLGLRWTLRNHHVLSAGIGFHSRIEPVSVYLTKVLNTKNVLDNWNRSLDLQRSFHAVVGYDYLIRNDLRFKSEIYFQYLYKVPVAKDSSDVFSMINYNGDELKHQLVNKGTGMNYGMEITIEKFYSHNYYIMFTGSLFHSSFTTYAGKQFNSLYDGNYIANLTGGKDFVFGKKKQMTLGVNTKLVTMGGNRKTPINISESQLQGETIYLNALTYTQRYPAFFRWDIGLYFKMNRKKFSWKLSVDFQNITNQQNIFSSRYDVLTNTVKNSYGLGFIPVINYKIDF